MWLPITKKVYWPPTSNSGATAVAAAASGSGSNGGVQPPVLPSGASSTAAVKSEGSISAASGKHK